MLRRTVGPLRLHRIERFSPCVFAVASSVLAVIVTSTPAAGQFQFAPPVPYNVGAPPLALATADLNRDSLPDVVASTDLGIVTLLNNGDGTLGLFTLVAAGTTGGGVIATDLSGDAVPDIAFADGHFLWVSLNNGDGTFKMPSPYSEPSASPFAVGVSGGDFNGDGHRDLALFTLGLFASGPTASIFTNNGTGTFTFWGRVKFANAVETTAADVDNDGYADLVSAENLGFNETPVFSIFINRKDGTFAAPTRYPSNGARTIIAAYLNDDTNLDLVLTSSPGTSIGVMLSLGQGNFRPPTYYPAGIARPRGTVADIDGNGTLDIVVNISGVVTALPGIGDGTFEASVPLFTIVRQDGLAPLPVDLDTNTAVDLVVPDSGSSSAVVHVAINSRLPPVDHGLRLSTDRGGNAGSVTLTIFGTELVEDSTVTLICAGQPEIVGGPVSVSGNGSSLTTTFDLLGAVPGSCDVIVSNPDGTLRSLTNAFTIEEGGAPELSIDIVGPSGVRPGRLAPFAVVVSNTGLIDAPFLSVRAELEGVMAFGSLAAAQIQALGCGLPPANVYLPSRQSRTFILKCTAELGTCPSLGAALFEREPSEDCLKELNDLAQAQAELVPLESELDKINEELQERIDRWQMVCPGTTPAEVEECTITNSRIWRLQLEKSIKESDIVSQRAEILWKQAELAQCLARQQRRRASISSEIQQPRALADAPNLLSQTTAQFCGVAPADPNEKVGVVGAGQAHFVKGIAPLLYTVHFENMPSATAPAADVRVVDVLDPSLDPSTLSIHSIRFGATEIELPVGMSSFSTGVDLRSTRGVLVNVAAGAVLGSLVVTFTSIDPATGKPPTDGSVGFLPPNLVPPEGEGSITFSIMPKQGLSTNTAITNSAEIFFDTNAAIITPAWLNTLDITKPTSGVLGLPSTVNSSSFPINWSGTDLGAGVQDYSVFVSDNGGPFTEFLTNTTATSATFTGQPGHTYGFYSIAMDLVGNIEGAKSVAEATTQVALDSIAPTTAASATPLPNSGGWNVSNLTVELAAADNPDGTGVKQITYGVSGALSIPSTIVPGNSISVPINVEGISTVTFFATDNADNAEPPKTLTVRIDKTQPSIGCSALPSILWPPNGGLVPIDVTVSLADSHSGSAGFVLKAVSSNEPGQGQIQGFVPGTVSTKGSLQSLRLGSGAGRVYTLTYEGIDLAGNAATCSTTVTVPHDLRGD